MKVEIQVEADQNNVILRNTINATHIAIQIGKEIRYVNIDELQLAIRKLAL